MLPHQPCTPLIYPQGEVGPREPLPSLCDPQILCGSHLGIIATAEFKVAMGVSAAWHSTIIHVPMNLLGTFSKASMSHTSHTTQQKSRSGLNSGAVRL